MPIAVRVCADLYGHKCNLELQYETAPPIADFCAECIHVFGAEAELLRSPQFPAVPFQIHRAQVFDDRVVQWVDLASPAQLRDGCQVYIFQPQSAWHVDVQKDLPPPRPPRVPRLQPHGAATPSLRAQSTYADPHLHVSAAAGASPHRPYSPSLAQSDARRALPAASAAGAAPGAGGAAGDGASEEEKVTYLFDEMSADQGLFRYPEFVRWVRELGVDLPEANVQELFTAADLNRDGAVTRDEFRNFSRRYPNVVDVMFHRAADRWDGAQRDQENRGFEQQLAANRARESDLRQQMEAVERQLAQLRQQCDSLQQENEEIAERMSRNVDLNRQLRERNVRLQQEERALMDKEILMERRRDALRDSEMEFLAQSQRFDAAASQLGSPRRSRYY
eukprot:TRINITY_DN23341_c0_g1_i1.p1 TRINITY_DN23341_c0_g1~~TRINITY_DN23341_c0_g1_i1.p1  ORF type:complete len:392 (+),score=144.68 TRINITY_DN23341_c0_g1_i1:101-1276(+)